MGRPSRTEIALKQEIGRLEDQLAFQTERITKANNTIENAKASIEMVRLCINALKGVSVDQISAPTVTSTRTNSILRELAQQKDRE